MKISEAFVEVYAKMDRLKADMKAAAGVTKAGMTKAAAAVKKSMAAIGGTVKRVMAGAIKWVKRLLLAFTALAVFIGYKSVKAWRVQEQAEKDVAAALRATGQEVDNNLAKLKRMASALQAVTTIGDEASLKFMSVAIGLGVTADKADDVVRAAVGLAAKLGKEVNAQMIQYIVLATQGEYTMLQRYIPALRQATTAEEKFAIIQRMVNEGFVQAQESAKTQGARLQQLKNSWGDLLEQVGRIISTGSGGLSVLDSIRKMVENVTDRLKMVPGQLGSVYKFIGRIRDRLATLFTRDMFATAIGALAKIGQFIGRLIDQAAAGITALFKKVGEFTLFKDLEGGFVDKIVSAIGVVFVKIKEWTKGFFNALKPYIYALGFTIRKAITGEDWLQEEIEGWFRQGDQALRLGGKSAESAGRKHAKERNAEIAARDLMRAAGIGQGGVAGKMKSITDEMKKIGDGFIDGMDKLLNGPKARPKWMDVFTPWGAFQYMQEHGISLPEGGGIEKKTKRAQQFGVGQFEHMAMQQTKEDKRHNEVKKELQKTNTQLAAGINVNMGWA